MSERRTWTRILPPVTVLILATVAALLSLYLYSLSGDAAATAAGCGSEGAIDCDHVLASRWSRWLSIPVSLPALLLFATMAATAGLLALGPASARLVRTGWIVLVAIGTLAACAALWFASLQVFVVGKFCPYCLGVHVCGIALTVVVFFSVPLRRRATYSMHYTGLTVASLPDRPEESDFGLRPLQLVPAIFVALAAAGTLIATQVLFPPPSYRVLTASQLQEAEGIEQASGASGVPSGNTAIDNQRPATIASAGDEGDSARKAKATPQTTTALSTGRQEPAPSEEAPARTAKTDDAASGGPAQPDRSRELDLLEGKLQIRVADFPLLGSPDADHVVVKLFDYTCPHCRTMHWRLESARQRYGKQLAIVLVPVPLNAGCNEGVKKTSPQHLYACLFARLAWLVWQESPESFQEYHQRLIEPVELSPPGKVQFEAGQFIGPDVVADRLGTVQLDDRLRRGVEVYQACGRGKIPKLILGDALIEGDIDSENAVFQLLEEHLGITPQ